MYERASIFTTALRTRRCSISQPDAQDIPVEFLIIYSSFVRTSSGMVSRLSLGILLTQDHVLSLLCWQKTFSVSIFFVLFDLKIFAWGTKYPRKFCVLTTLCDHISWTIQPSTELVLLHKAKSVRQTSQSTQGYSQGRTWVLSIVGTGNVMQSTTQIFGCGCGSVDNRERMWWEEGASHESLKSKLQTFSAEEHFFSDFYSLYKASTASLPLPPYYLL